MSDYSEMFHILNEFVFYHLFIAPFQSHTHTHTHAHTHTFTSSPSFSPHCDRPPPHPLLPPLCSFTSSPSSLLPPSSPPFIHPSSLSLLYIHAPSSLSSIPLFFQHCFFLPASLEMFPTTFSFLLSNFNPSLFLSIYPSTWYIGGPQKTPIMPDLLVTHSLRLYTQLHQGTLLTSHLILHPLTFFCPTPCLLPFLFSPPPQPPFLSTKHLTFQTVQMIHFYLSWHLAKSFTTFSLS